MKTAQEIIKNLLDLQCNPDKFDVLESVNILDCAKEYLATGGWLPISDYDPKTMPEKCYIKGTDWLIPCDEDGAYGVCSGGYEYEMLANYMPDSFEDGFDWMFLGEIYRPTHFQYLPQPPKEKNNEIFM